MTSTWARRTLTAALAAGALLAAVACSSETTVVAGPDAGGISVTGRGTVNVTPDIALLNLGVEVTAPTVAEARDRAAESLDAVRASLRRNGVEDRDVQTQFLSIRPQYGTRLAAPATPIPDRQVPPEPPTPTPAPIPPGEPVITGYIVTNQVSAKLRDLEQVSRILDEAVAAGGDAVRVNGIQFTVDEPERHYAEARELAMNEAHATAEDLARLGGVNLGAPRNINESVFPGPVAAFDRAQIAPPGTGGVATPIDPGETQINVQVNVVYEVE